MRSLVFLATFLILLFSPLSGLAQIIRESKQASNPSQPDANPTPLVKLNGLKGIVLAVVNNEELLMQSDKKYLGIKYGQEYWKMGFGRGDEIQVWGEMIPERLLGNEFKADKIELVKRAENRPEPLMIKTISEVLTMTRSEQPVVTFGKLEEFKGTRARLSHQGSSLWVELGTNKIRDMFPYSEGVDLIVLGRFTDSPIRGPEMQAILGRPLKTLQRPGEPDQAQDIEQVLKDRPIGKTIRANGRIAVFVGESNTSFLYQDKNVLIIRRSEQYLSMDLPGGQEVDVIGVFDVETHNGREYGVLKEARIDPLAKLQAVKKMKEEIKNKEGVKDVK